jgi:hypothetical protein
MACGGGAWYNPCDFHFKFRFAFLLYLVQWRLPASRSLHEDPHGVGSFGHSLTLCYIMPRASGWRFGVDRSRHPCPLYPDFSGKVLHIAKSVSYSVGFSYQFAGRKGCISIVVIYQDEAGADL